MPEKVIREVVAYYCDDCGGLLEYSGKHDRVKGEVVWVHYCTSCHNRYDFDDIYPIYRAVDNG